MNYPAMRERDTEYVEWVKVVWVHVALKVENLMPKIHPFPTQQTMPLVTGLHLPRGRGPAHNPLWADNRLPVAQKQRRGEK